MIEHTRLALLVDRALARTISPEEREELLGLMADPKHKAAVEDFLRQAWHAFEPAQSIFREDQAANMLQSILETTPMDLAVASEIRPLYSVWPKVVAAALLVVAVAVGYYYYRATQVPAGLSLADAVEQSQIRPGGERAVLTMGDGRTILLDGAADGLLATEAGVDINKVDDGRLLYHSNGHASTELIYHTITVPKGGEYRLVLPDGSKVYLNSASSLHYPVQFSKNRREVELTGEGYFEVSNQSLANGRNVPFIVHTPTQAVEVLGTVFNVHAYGDVEAVRTTLLEGLVKVRNATGDTVLLSPGEAAINEYGGKRLRVAAANVDLDVAWQRGYFVFENEHIKSIMARVARWYDVEVDYVGELQELRFGGVFQRSKSIVQLLENFRETGLIDFKIIERRVVVMAK